MSTRQPSSRPSRGARLGAFGGPMLILVLALGGGAAGCSGAGSDGGAGAMTPAAHEAMVPRGDMEMPAADQVQATWKARPDYVRDAPAAVQSAYAYALARPDVIQWLPCYCGCAAMDHRSNLECFFQRREAGGPYAYEEHASYCDICVRTANMAQQMLQDGKTMIQIRAAVDAAFGGTAPGTDTPLPPAS